jgi:hypothetical protein
MRYGVGLELQGNLAGLVDVASEQGGPAESRQRDDDHHGEPEAASRADQRADLPLPVHAATLLGQWPSVGAALHFQMHRLETI